MLTYLGVFVFWAAIGGVCGYMVVWIFLSKTPPKPTRYSGVFQLECGMGVPLRAESFQVAGNNIEFFNIEGTACEAVIRNAYECDEDLRPNLEVISTKEVLLIVRPQLCRLLTQNGRIKECAVMSRYPIEHLPNYELIT